jgi:hypothetical protein
MTTRTLHRVVGLVMLLPFLGWAVTGAIFFIKPGYAGAYESLAVRTYPLDTSLAVDGNALWREARFVRTVLGDHLLVRKGRGDWQNLNPRTLDQRPAPTESQLRELVTDALSANPERYGHIVSVTGGVANTDTGVRVTLNWYRLTLSQRGVDTDRLDALYRIHYLQWTGIAAIDKVVGAVGLILILVLSGLGVRLFFRAK